MTAKIKNDSCHRGFNARKIEQLKMLLRLKRHFQNIIEAFWTYLNGKKYSILYHFLTCKEPFGIQKYNSLLKPVTFRRATYNMLLKDNSETCWAAVQKNWVSTTSQMVLKLTIFLFLHSPSSFKNSQPFERIVELRKFSANFQLKARSKLSLIQRTEQIFCDSFKIAYIT